jgi:hypothetical protein
MFILGLSISLLPGCQTWGPRAIRYGRPDYNEVIHLTSQQQLMLNILRVANHEPTLIVDVQQINASVLFQGSLNAQISGIGTSRRSGYESGTVGLGTLEYQEAPTIQYTPLIGQALVAQITRPLTPDNIANLINSDWPLVSVLTLVPDRITPGYKDFFPAVDAIVELDQYGAVVISAARYADIVAAMPLNVSRLATPSKQSGDSSGSQPNDTLVLYLRLEHPALEPLERNQQERRAQLNILHLWLRLLRIYNPEQVSKQRFEALNSAIEQEGFSIQNLVAQLPNYIAIRTIGVSRDKSKIFPPELRVRSGLGILKAAAEPPDVKIEFVNPQEYRAIREHPWNRRNDLDRKPGSCHEVNFYTVLRSDLTEPQRRSDTPANSLLNPGSITQYSRAVSKAEDFLRSGQYKCAFTTSDNLDVDDYDEVEQETALGEQRRFILVIQDSKPPDRDVYVSIRRDGEWFYIDKRDDVSQRNFVLLGQFLTMQAIAPQTPPVSPSILVGPR